MSEHYKYRLLPPPPGEKHAALRDDIAAMGLLTPIVVDEHGNVLDGFERELACAELGIKSVPFVVKSGLTEKQKIEYILSINLMRRHLDKRQSKMLAANLRARGWAQERIALNLGVDQKTISNWLKEQFRNSPEPTTVAGKDGKQYPAKKTARLKRESQVQKQERLRVLSVGPERIAKIMGALSDRLQYVWAWLAHIVIQSVERLLAWVGRQQRS